MLFYWFSLYLLFILILNWYGLIGELSLSFILYLSIKLNCICFILNWFFFCFTALFKHLIFSLSLQDNYILLLLFLFLRYRFKLNYFQSLNFNLFNIIVTIIRLYRIRTFRKEPISYFFERILFFLRNVNHFNLLDSICFNFLCRFYIKIFKNSFRGFITLYFLWFRHLHQMLDL